jgi:hypothetical protein
LGLPAERSLRLREQQLRRRALWPHAVSLACPHHGHAARPDSTRSPHRPDGHDNAADWSGACTCGLTTAIVLARQSTDASLPPQHCHPYALAIRVGRGDLGSGALGC